MRTRGIRQQDVEVTLAAPHEVCDTPEDSTRYTRTMTDGRTLKVWVLRPPLVPDQYFIKSTAWKD